MYIPIFRRLLYASYTLPELVHTLAGVVGVHGVIGSSEVAPLVHVDNRYVPGYDRYDVYTDQ